MIPYQRDILEVNFRLLNEREFKPHPVIVISNNEVNEYEETFVGVMISSSVNYDEYTVKIDNKMLTNPLSKPSQIRSHLIQTFSFSDIENKISALKKDYFNGILKKILKHNF